MIDRYLVKGHTGMTFPAGDLAACIGWSALDVEEKIKDKDNEVFAIPCAALLIGAPDYTGLEGLLRLLQTPEARVNVRLRTKWEPGPRRVEVTFWSRESRWANTERPWQKTIGPLMLHAEPKDPQEHFERARMYAKDGKRLVFDLLNTLTGMAVRTIFATKSTDAFSGRYSRESVMPVRHDLV